jgi:hypothetical protein
MQIGLTLEQIGIIIAVISVVVGVILGLQSAKDWSKDRNAGLFLQYQLQAFDEQFIKNLLEITNIWEWKDIKEFWEKYGSPEKFARFMSVGTVFDSMGVLVKRKYIPMNMVPELLIATVRSFWLKVSPIAEQIGIDVQRPNTFQNIEYLFNEIQKLDASKAM